MPGRPIKLVTGYFYHIFNRGVAKSPTYFTPFDYDRFTELINYYRYQSTTIRYSDFIKLPLIDQSIIWSRLMHDGVRVEIHAFCLMPNHFHLLLRQTENYGISKFMGDITNSYTKYVNTKSNRVGPLFQGKFKSVFVESGEQFLHVSRYIHLNPYADHVVKDFIELKNYPYSSLKDYSDKHGREFVETGTCINELQTRRHYLEFIQNRTDYQRTLSHLKKLRID